MPERFAELNERTCLVFLALIVLVLKAQPGTPNRMDRYERTHICIETEHDELGARDDCGERDDIAKRSTSLLFAFLLRIRKPAFLMLGWTA